ncbi:hypothetical protein PMW_10 [Pseudomonas phage phiPMW]|uniref:Uncharacterized protein n=1 Tax=Pseudomonas phage phiPMW TaxID=1815582 RepID=A0A1S5R145_9CAUD|nr:hypothetical protein FDG97_gp010 [Pseudomonas phage phiPMW]ANA49135.1 hypothetical protein PMW_10 [Pseudomonas phage phiPMW]
MNNPVQSFEDFVKDLKGEVAFTQRDMYNMYLIGRLDGAISHTQLSVKEKKNDS